MQCKFMTVTGPGKYDTESWSIPVSSEKTASKEVKEFTKTILPKPLEFFITSLFITSHHPRGGSKPEVIMSMSSKDVAKAVQDIQQKSKA